MRKMQIIKLNQTLNVTKILGRDMCMRKKKPNDSIICHFFILDGIKERGTLSYKNAVTFA